MTRERLALLLAACLAGALAASKHELTKSGIERRKRAAAAAEKFPRPPSNLSLEELEYDRVLGVGWCNAAFLARHPSLDAPLAVKITNGDPRSDCGAAAGLERDLFTIAEAPPHSASIPRARVAVRVPSSLARHGAAVEQPPGHPC